MGGYHGKSFSARHLFTCIFTTQVLSFEAAQQFAKQIDSPIYVSKEGVRGEPCDWWRTAFQRRFRGGGGVGEVR